MPRLDSGQRTKPSDSVLNTYTKSAISQLLLVIEQKFLHHFKANNVYHIFPIELDLNFYFFI